jgi:tRNA(Ile)-lysidine synthase
MMRIPFLPKVLKAVRQHGMLAYGDRIVVAVSGGPDSLVLLHTLLALREKYDLTLTVAHLDHSLRPESKEDARFVKEVAKSLGVASYSKRVDVAGFCKRKRRSLEEGAREVRYAFLEGVAQKARASKIALGHTMDDQAETVLMRMIRGAGSKGLEGIPPVRGKIIRPLIGVKRKEIIEFLGQHKLPYLTDPTNWAPRFLRNRIRLRLIPLLEKEYNPRITETLARTGQLLASEQVKETSGEQAWVRAVSERGRGRTTKIVLDLSKVLGYNKMLRRKAVREAVKRIRGDLRGIGFVHTESILALAEGRVGGEVELPGGFRAKKAYGEIVFEKDLPPAPARPFTLSVAVPGVTKLPGGSLKTSLHPIIKAPRAWRKMDGRVAWFDLERVHLPLNVRSRKEGDRFWPLGLPGLKRLKEVLIDDKVPREERDRLPLLADREGILWIVGHRITEKAKLRPQTKKALKVEFIASQLTKWQTSEPF